VNLEIFLVVLGVWNLTISYLLWRMAREFRRISKGIDKEQLKEVLSGFEAIEKRLNKIEADGKFHFQKSSLVKFNPFAELGGDQSFSLALLDDENRGIVITSLHGRQATRIYTKVIGDGKVKLSEEEKKAVKQATRAKQ